MLYNYSKRMNVILEGKGLTTDDLRKMTKLSYTTVYGFLNYGLNIDLITFERMLKALNVSVEYFFNSVDRKD